MDRPCEPVVGVMGCEHAHVVALTYELVRQSFDVTPHSPRI